MSVVRFIMQGRKTFGPTNKAGTFVILDTITGETLDRFTTIGGATEVIAKRYPIDTPIVFRWDYSEHDSFEPMTIEQWLRRTAIARSIPKDGIEEHIASVRAESAKREQAGVWS